jgi:hypothetical protein
MEIVRKRLTPDELQSPRIRYNPATGQVEQTNDGGVTWAPAPSQDPRLIYQQLPVATSNPRCDAAARMAALLQQHIELQITNVDAGATQIFLANTLVTAASFAFGITIVFPAVLTFVGTVLALGSVALHGAFDTYDWDALKCKIYCLVSTDGRLNQAGLDALYEFLLEGTVTQNLVLGGTLSYMGYGVLSDAAALRTETGDCTSCTCAACQYKRLNEGGFSGWNIGDFVPGIAGGVYDTLNDRVIGRWRQLSGSYWGVYVLTSVDLGAFETITLTFDGFSTRQASGQFGRLTIRDGSGVDVFGEDWRNDKAVYTFGTPGVLLEGWGGMEIIAQVWNSSELDGAFINLLEICINGIPAT